MEGYYAGERMIQHIASTKYQTIDNAIAVKQELIDNFEEKFGYTEEQDEFIRDYAYNYGMLDALKKG